VQRGLSATETGGKAASMPAAPSLVPEGSRPQCGIACPVLCPVLCYGAGRWCGRGRGMRTALPWQEWHGVQVVCFGKVCVGRWQEVLHRQVVGWEAPPGNILVVRVFTQHKKSLRLSSRSGVSAFLLRVSFYACCSSCSFCSGPSAVASLPCSRARCWRRCIDASLPMNSGGCPE